MYSIEQPIQALQQAYKSLNKKYFADQLDDKVIITIQSRGRQKASLAWYGANLWSNGDDKARIAEINISAETLKASCPFESLLHEMIHHHCKQEGIKEVSRGSSYHNKRFLVEAEARDLEVSFSKKCGHGHTKGTETLKAYVAKTFKTDAFDYQRVSIDKKAKPSHIRKYSCGCGQTFRASKQVFAICEICASQFEEVN